MALTAYEQDVLESLKNSNNFDDEDHLAAQKSANTSTSPTFVRMQKGTAGQPVNYNAQIDVIAKLNYTLVADNSVVAPAALPAAAQTGLPVYIFGISDYESGYSAAFQQQPLNAVWSLVGIFTIGIDDVTAAKFTNVLQNVKKGDLLFQYKYAATHYAWVVVSVDQLGYASLLKSTNSDLFQFNQIRYSVLDDTKISQFNNKIKFISQTLFGRVSGNDLSPASYRDPKNQQKSIIDMRFSKVIDKNTIIATNLNYDVISINWCLFIDKVQLVGGKL